MIADAIKAISDQAVQAEAAKNEHFHPPEEPPHVYLMAGERIQAEPQPRTHAARNLQAIVAFAAENKDKAAIWYSREAVTCLLDDETRRDKVTLALGLSPQMKTMLDWGSSPAGKSLKQKDFIRVLKVTFADSTSQGNLLPVVREIEFKVNQSGSASISHTKASVGRSVETELKTSRGDAVLPDYVALDCPIWENAIEVSTTVKSALDVDAATETFILTPLPRQIERALAFGEARLLTLLSQMLAEVGVGAPEGAVYYVCP